MADQYTNLPASAAMSWKKSVADASALPSANNQIGDTRVTNNDQSIYIWNGTSWIQAADPGINSGITALTGDVTAVGPGSAVATIANSAVTNAKLASMNNNTVKGNKSGSLAAPSDLALASLSEATSNVLVITGSNNLVGAGTIQVLAASSTQNGYLSSTDKVKLDNTSGTNSGNVTLTAVGASANANGASLSGQALTLQPASSSFPGVMTAADKVALDEAALANNPQRRLILMDDFVTRDNALNANRYGQLNWEAIVNASGAVTYPNPSGLAGTFGLVQVAAAAGSGSYAALSLGASTSNIAAVNIQSPVSSITVRGRLRFSQIIQLSDFPIYFIGLSSLASNPLGAARAMGLVLDEGNLGISNLTLYSKNNTITQGVDMGVIPAANAFFTFEMVYTPTSLTLSINGGAPIAQTSGFFPVTGTVAPVIFASKTGTTDTPNVQVDYFQMIIAASSR